MASIELIFWGTILVVTALSEVMTMRVIAVWFTVGCATSFAVALLTDWGMGAQAAAFAVVSLFSLGMYSFVVKRKYRRLRNCGNMDCIVTQDIDNTFGVGCVFIGGEQWAALSHDGQFIPVNTVVTVAKQSKNY
jgi:membrane protein implicated in regulation of membrane protease activity